MVSRLRGDLYTTRRVSLQRYTACPLLFDVNMLAANILPVYTRIGKETWLDPLLHYRRRQGMDALCPRRNVDTLRSIRVAIQYAWKGKKRKSTGSVQTKILTPVRPILLKRVSRPVATT